MASVQVQFEKVLSAACIQRSSQTITATDRRVFIFGGELKAREPVDNDMLVVELDADVPRLSKVFDADTPLCPSPRIGTASALVNGKIYYFSGRGGEAMAPINEHGALYAFDVVQRTYSLVAPSNAFPEDDEMAADASALAGTTTTVALTGGNDDYDPDRTPFVPQARSYHALTSDGDACLYLHAGCSQTGRLSDLWRFDTRTRAWTELAPAPDPPRGGASIAWVAESATATRSAAAGRTGRLYRMNGFDGTSEQGGAIDAYDPATNSWSTPWSWRAEAAAADGGVRRGPAPRSVAALLPLKMAGKDWLVTLFGEREPSPGALGHKAAGKMLEDVWVLDLTSGVWTKAVPASGHNGKGAGDDGSRDNGSDSNSNNNDNKQDNSSSSNGSNGRPLPRGWFAADVLPGPQPSIVVQGGLGENNQRLGDLWTLTFSVV